MHRKFCTQRQRSQGPFANGSDAEDAYSGQESRQSRMQLPRGENHSDPIPNPGLLPHQLKDRDSYSPEKVGVGRPDLLLPCYR